jgi:Holliday junction resolvase RusA-like endonuclease
MLGITIDLPGATIKPYVRMTKRGKYVNPQAQEYLSSKADLQYQVKQAMTEQGYEMLPEATPLWVAVYVTAPVSQGHRADADNILKAVLDACNGIVWVDDRWIDDVSIRRNFGDPYLGISANIIKKER